MKSTRRRFLEASGATAVLAPVCALTHAAAAEPSRSVLLWRQDHALPSFHRPEHLQVVGIGSLSGDQQVLFTTLQGVINRREPRIYLLISGDNTDQIWLDTIKVPYETVSDPLRLIDRYRSEVQGTIVYDPALADSINVATSLAGLKNAVVTSADLAAQYDIPIIEDLRGRFTDKFEAYKWLIDNYWPSLNHRLLTGISPASASFISTVTWTTLFKVTQPVVDASNRDQYTADLSSLLGTGAIYVRFQDAYPQDGWGPSVGHVTVIADGTNIADFQPGTADEGAFLYEADSSSFASAWRFADGNSYFIYRFHPPAGTKTLTLKVEMWNEFFVTATNVEPLVYNPFANFRDYIVATAALVFWLDPLLPAEAALFTEILQKVQPDTPYLGWFAGGHEDAGVTLCSQNGVPVVAADFFNNGTVFGGIEAPLRAWQQPPPRTSHQNKVYVTLTMSEGDNLQFCEHRMRSIWDDPNRGKSPLNWSISPLLLDAAPAMLSYYQRTQTPNDLLVAGPSGAGYTYPGDWLLSALPSFTKRTGAYMRRTGMDVIYALNRANDTYIDLAPTVAQQYKDDIFLLGILYNWISKSALSTPAGLPVITQVGISSVAQGQAVLADTTQSWNGTNPLFVALGVLAWNMTPSDVNTLVSSLESHFEVVRADVFFYLIRKSLAGR